MPAAPLPFALFVIAAVMSVSMNPAPPRSR
jgi:hypothetical protein